MNMEGTDRRLHRLHDGDLSADERAALDVEIAAEPELQKKLEGLHEVGVVVRAARTDDAAIDSEALWTAIEANISASAPLVEQKMAAEAAPGVKPTLRAIEGGASPATKPVEDTRSRRRRYIGIGVGVFAIAAAALLMIYGPPDAQPETVATDTTPPESTTPDTTAPDEQPTSVADASDYTEVLAVDFGTNVGTIFAVEGEGGQRYAVVWLDDVLKRDEGDATTDAPATPD